MNDSVRNLAARLVGKEPCIDIETLRALRGIEQPSENQDPAEDTIDVEIDGAEPGPRMSDYEDVLPDEEPAEQSDARKSRSGYKAPGGDEVPAGSAAFKEQWRSGLILTEKNVPRALLANAITALRLAPQWLDVLAHDCFALSTTAQSPPPWEARKNQWSSRPWTPIDDVLTANWLQHQGICVGTDIAQQAVEVVAQDRSFHPVRDYLDGLKWDQVSRIDGWLTKYLGVSPTPYSTEVGRTSLIAGVARIRDPGCKVDTVMILEGKQGIGMGKGWDCVVICGC